jgi:quinol monooxygenase YgiN
MPSDPAEEATGMAGVLTVVAKIYPKMGREGEVEALLVKMRPPCTSTSPTASSTDRTGQRVSRPRSYFYEQYRTDAAFELHRTAPHLAGYRTEMKESSWHDLPKSSSAARSQPERQAGAATSLPGTGLSEIAHDMNAAAPESVAPAMMNAA